MLYAASGPLSDEAPEVGSIHKAVVKRIEPYGVFVQMEGYRRHGLVHSSQVRMPMGVGGGRRHGLVHSSQVRMPMGVNVWGGPGA